MNEVEVSAQHASSQPVEGILELPASCLKCIGGGVRVGSGFG
jgi:hypothetical protein